MTKSLSQFEHTQIITPNEYETNEKMISRTIYEKKMLQIVVVAIQF